MAARPQPPAAKRRRRLVAGVVGLIALGLPAGAQAHGTTSVDALDFEARLTAVAPRTKSVSAAVLDGDRKLALLVEDSHTVVVLGYAGEPFLRFSAAGVEVNERSATASIVKLAKRGSERALSAGAPPRWSSLSKRARYAWHDHRLGPKPGTAYGEGDVSGWTIPIVVDGTPDRISGRLWHARGPGLWPWLVLLGGAVGVGLALVRQRGRIIEVAAVAGSVTACAAALLVSIALGFAPGNQASAAWTSTTVSVVIAAAGLAALAVARQLRPAVAGVVALFAALAGLSHVGVLVHAYVIALLPAAIMRAATATSVCAGVIAVAASLVFFLGQTPDPGTARNRARSAGRAMAVPRGKARSG